MVSVEQALDLVRKNVPVLGNETLPISHCLGRALAMDVFSKIDIPSFPQSAMDGYAVNALGDVEVGDSFTMIGEVQAGDTNEIDITPGQAVRIFTGAAVPKDATTVVIQETITAQGSKITVNKMVADGANIRAQGEQIMRGDTGLQEGTVLTPSGIGFLAMMGYAKVKVIKKPIIHLVVTGNELVSPGEALKYGEIYESNSVTLASALAQYGYPVTKIHFVKDTYEETLSNLQIALNESDVVITSGGISVGDYDFVGRAFRELAVEEHFYKVKQKPGKPLFFATNKNTVVFALPGNPASALTSLYYYILPAVSQMSGKGFDGLNASQLPLVGGYTKKGDRAQFLKGFLTDEGVEILDGQSSAMMHTYAITNALIFIPAEKVEIEENGLVEVFML
ncbi:MAG: molybdopterin molybdotransferase [Salibacteraceae bacterium]|jgi:molybdopterin molybdotransferase